MYAVPSYIYMAGMKYNSKECIKPVTVEVVYVKHRSHTSACDTLQPTNQPISQPYFDSCISFQNILPQDFPYSF